MISPQLIGFLIFTIYPIFWVLRWAWYSYDGVTAEYIGLQNFVRVFTRDPYYWHSVLNSFILSFGKLAVEIPLALILAVILNRKLKGQYVQNSVFHAQYYQCGDNRLDFLLLICLLCGDYK
ncbi:MAG TPA: sugar ABC transporter permease, partial [Bacillota bacterium]|nr:sugar ABC transporter permease [Bacillota bacterium]